MSILEELTKEGLIEKSQIGDIKNRAKEKFGGDIDQALIEAGIKEEKILEVKGKFLQIPIKKVNREEISFDALKYISEDSATHYHFVPLALSEGVLEVGVINAEDIQTMDALQFISAKLGIPFKIYLISKSDYEVVMESYKGIGNQVKKALEEINQDEKESLNEENLSKEITNTKVGEEAKIVEDAPVIKIVAVILRNAIEGEASDIHIEFTGRKVDFRVSTMPAYYGEKVVMRILDAEKGVKSIEQLGLSDTNLNMVRDAIKRPYGLILITGPTGSRKSTTLYSMMNELDKEKSNIPARYSSGFDWSPRYFYTSHK